MNQLATGPFDVAMTPAGAPDKAGVVAIGQFALDKTYHGALDAKGTGQMLTAMTDTPGSAAYVAIERVTGTLDGKSGSFALQHAGTMYADPAASPDGNAEHLSIAIVPDSGDGELAGIAGSLRIVRADGMHTYALWYTLPVRSAV